MRFHPILQTWRAPPGRGLRRAHRHPVRAVGDGVVEFAGVQNGFGNVVFVRHRNNHTTVYAHLSRILVRTAKAWCRDRTWVLWAPPAGPPGPHLHFEFRVNGPAPRPDDDCAPKRPVPVSASAKPAI